MKHGTFYFIVAGVLCTALGAPFGGPAAGNSDSYNECSARCAPLQGGEGWAKCITTCVRTKKKNEPMGESEVKKKMRDCEERCSSYTGVDRVRCIRICLDAKKEQRPARIVRQPAATVPDPCETRCAVLSGTLKDRCTARCRNDTKFNRNADRSR